MTPRPVRSDPEILGGTPDQVSIRRFNSVPGRDVRRAHHETGEQPSNRRIQTSVVVASTRRLASESAHSCLPQQFCCATVLLCNRRGGVDELLRS